MTQYTWQWQCKTEYLFYSNKTRGLSCISTKTVQLARHATMSVGRILLLAAAVIASAPAVKGTDSDGLGRVTRFVCAHCTSTGKLSSHCLFLNRAAVRRHIAASRPCHAAQEGIRQIQMESRSGDIMHDHGRRWGRGRLSSGRPTPARR